MTQAFDRTHGASYANLPAIASAHNARFRAALDLRKGRARRETGLFGVEGAREIGHAMEGGFNPVEVLACVEILSSQSARTLDSLAKRGLPSARLTPSLFERLAVRESSDGLWVSFQSRTTTLESLRLPPEPLIVAMEGVEKPGNLGALARTAEAAGANVMALLDPVADPFNPNTIRSSLGAVFRIPIALADSPHQFMDYCRSEGIRVVSASPAASKPYYEIDYRGSLAIVLGSEAEGLSEPLVTSAGLDVVRIPMQGGIDSLNVSVAGAVLLFEAMRQRASS